MNWTKLAVAAALGVALVGPMGCATLTRQGRSDWRIVIATNAAPAERYAAEELQRYLERISGARLALGTEAGPAAAHEIVVGKSSRLNGLKPAIDFAKLGSDGFVLRSGAGRIVIAGGGPRGTLYGVYALLEDHFGVRWFAPDCEVVPQHARLAVPDLDVTQVPPLEYREVYWSEPLHSADFAARLRLNGANYGLTERHGGCAAVYFPFVHSLDMLVPPELFQSHPEYFPEIKGVRKSGYVQRCLSNPDVVKMSIARVRQWIKEHPEANIISVSQNDTFNQCQCATCQALDDAEGSPAASLIKFVNTIADAIAAEHPNVRIDTLAYQYTRQPPKTLRPHPNVIIRLCSIECCFAHPLDGCPSTANKKFLADIAAWQPVAPHLYVWDYTTDFAHYQQPFPNFAALQGNVRCFVAHGVKGLFEQGNYSTGGAGELEPLRTYLLAKLLWNPDADVPRLTAEFLAGYYGPAAGALGSYVNLMQQQVATTNTHAHIFDGPKVPYLNKDFLTAANILLDEAERQAVGNETILRRVQTARLPVWYVQLAAEPVNGAARAELLEKFLAVARRAGVSNISEGQTLDAWAQQMAGK
jgi:hypothetical protein